MDDIDPTKLRPATDEEILFSLAHGLRYDGKRRIHYADDHMARIAVARRSGDDAVWQPPDR